MPLLPSHTLILTHSLTCLTISLILLTTPSLLTSAGPVWLIGEAMHIRDTPSFSLPSEPLASLALVIAVLAVVESVFAGNLGGGVEIAKKSGGNGRHDIQAFAEQAALVHGSQAQWTIIAIAKSLGFGLLVTYCYLTSPREERTGYTVSMESGAGRFKLGHLNNRVTFVASFIEMLFWGYLWTTLREERRELARDIKRRREEAREKGEDWAG